MHASLWHGCIHSPEAKSLCCDMKTAASALHSTVWISPVTCPQTPALTWLATCAALQITLKPGASVKRAASALHKLASGNELKGHLTWTDRNQYEHEVASLQRFLVDASVSGGGLWANMTRRLNTCNAFFMDAPVPWRRATDDSGMSLRMHKARGQRFPPLVLPGPHCKVGIVVPYWQTVPCTLLIAVRFPQQNAP